MTGVYSFQTTKARFNQYKVEDTCPLCRLEPEDLSHMLLRCPALADTREAPLSDIRGLVKESVVVKYGHRGRDLRWLQCWLIVIT